jgi:phosphoribosyl-AMP cyclohydrolase
MGHEATLALPLGYLLDRVAFPPYMDAKPLLSQVKFNEQGLVPAIVQEEGTGRVLMMAWMNVDSLSQTLETKRTHFWSRSRKSLWLKGETSGHVQEVKKISIDCDGDTLLITVVQTGAACHEGYKSCFFREVNPEAGSLGIIESKLDASGGGRT